MDSGIGFFNFSVDKIAPRDNLSLDRARVRMLYYSLLLGIYVLTVLQVNIYYQHLSRLATINAIMLGIIVFLFKWLTYRANWKAIAHLLLTTLTLINLIDVFIILQIVSSVSVVVVVMVMLFSFYMLGPKVGLIYSLLNILAVAAFIALQGYNIYSINITPERPGQSTVIIGLISCFSFIILVQSHFYHSYLKNNNLLKKTFEEQDALNDKYKQAIDKAEQSYEERSEFLSTMSHEIRTPLNAVIGMSNLLLMDDPRPDQKENLEVLKFSAGNLLAIVNDVLDFNKIESGKHVFENVQLNLAELMQNIYAVQKLSASNKGLGFKLEVDDILREKEVFAEPARINQILSNLISNAIKFTHKGGIEIKASCIEQKTSMLAVNFSVKDTGIGIEQDKLSAIFEPFTQQSLSTTRQYGGAGLGLAIVKRLLASQGLQVQVISKPGKGSEFSFVMEFAIAAEKACPAAVKKISLVQAIETARQNTLNDLKVLVAEDNPVNVMLIKKLL